MKICIGAISISELISLKFDRDISMLYLIDSTIYRCFGVYFMGLGGINKNTDETYVGDL